MNKKAFTLIETLIGITLITVVLTAVTGLILSTLLSNQRNEHVLQASAIAAEGIEVMRHIRDSNWLQNYSWDGGADEWGTDFALDDENVEDLITLYLKEDGCAHQWCFSVNEEHGEIEDASGFVFNRVIDISHVLDEDGVVIPGTCEVTATVTWDEKGVERSTSISTFLTDWQ